ncbi:MAG: response regulator [Proteobacteria bacterium]|nr:response regulator [Pseudomonadota bacterium]
MATSIGDRRPHRLWLYAFLSLGILGAIVIFAGNLRSRNVAFEMESARVGEAAARLLSSLSGALLLGSDTFYDGAPDDALRKAAEHGREQAAAQIEADLSLLADFVTSDQSRDAIKDLMANLARAKVVLDEHDRLALEIGDYQSPGLRQEFSVAGRKLNAPLAELANPNALSLRHFLEMKTAKDAFLADVAPEDRASARQALAAFTRDIQKANLPAAERDRLLDALAEYDAAFERLSGAMVALSAAGRELGQLFTDSSAVLGRVVGDVAAEVAAERKRRNQLTNVSLVVVGGILTLVVSSYIGLSLRTADRLQHREAELRETGERMRDLARVTSDILWEVDADGFVRNVDGPGTFTSCYGPRMLGHRFTDVLRDLGAQFSDNLDLGALLAGHAPFRDREYKVVMPVSKQTSWYTLSGLPAFDTQGVFTGYRCASKDITDAKQLFLEREEFRNQLSSTLSHLPAAAFRMEESAGGRLPKFVSHNAGDVLGVPAAEILSRGGDSAFFIHGEDRGRFDQEITEGLNARGSASARGRIVQSDGAIRWIQALLRRTEGPDNRGTIDGIWIDVTEDELKTRQMHDVEAAIEAASDAIVIFGPDNAEVVYANAAVYRTFGLPSDRPLDIVAVRACVRMSDDEIVAMRAAMMEGVARAGRWTGRLPIIRADGSHGIVFARVSGLSDGRFLHVLTDVTEEELRVRQLRDIGAAIDAASDGIMFFAADWSLLFANASAYRIFDLPTGAQLPDFHRRLGLSEAQAEANRVSIREAVERDGYWSGSFSVERGDGGRAPLLVRVTGGLDEGKLLYVISDMTALNQARRELEQQIERTRQQNALVARALDSVQDYIVIEDRRGYITYVNQTTLDTLACSLEEVQGTSFFSNIRVKFDDNERIKRQVAAGLTIVGTWSGELRVTGPNDRRQVLNLRVSRLADGGALYVATDITVQRLAESEEAKLKQRLADAERMEAIGRLAGGIAHDFNNITGATRAFADLLVDDLPPDSVQRTYAERIVNACRRASELVKEVMTFSRAAQAERRPLDVAGVFAEGVDILAAKRPLHIALDFQNLDAAAVVEANAGQIIQVLVNLVMNAFDAIESSAGRVTVRVERMNALRMALERTDPGFREERDQTGPVFRHGQGVLENGVEYVRLTIEDTGPGMERATLQRIFEPFFTTKGRDRGTGLGVPVVSSIVTAHSGLMQVYTRRNRGTAVAVYFPVSNKVSLAVEEKRAEHNLRGNERILVVDDEIDLADAISIGLTRLGYETAPVYTPTEALSLFAEAPGSWDILISDEVMPHMKGLQLVREVRALCPDMKIILCTGHSDAANEETARMAGANLFLHKPVTAEELAQAVRRLIDG